MLGGIQHVIAEAGGQGCQTFAGLVEGGLTLTVETDTPLLHGEQFGLENALAGAVEGLTGLVAQLAEGPMQHLALSKAIAQTDDIGLLGGVGVPQLRRIADAVEVGDHAPTPAKPLANALHRLHHLLPAEEGVTVQTEAKRFLQIRELLFEFLQ